MRALWAIVAVAMSVLSFGGPAAAQDGDRTYSGRIFNTTMFIEGRVRFDLHFAGARVTGSMTLTGRLTGDGPVEGTRDGSHCEIRTRAGVDLRGVCDEVGFTGTYVTADGQRGRFNTRMVDGDAPQMSSAEAYRRSTLPPSVRAAEDEYARGAGVADFQAQVRTLAHGLTNWGNRPPTDLINGRSFFADAGLDEVRIRRYLRDHFGGDIRFLPVRWGSAMTIDRNPIAEFVLPFCSPRADFCHEPYDAIDGAVVVSVRATRTDQYLYFYAERRGEAVFCGVQGVAIDCRPGNPVGAEPRYRLSRYDFQSLFESLVGGYEGNPNRFASATPVSAASPHAACVDYQIATHGSYGVNNRGDYVPGTSSSSQTYVVRNRCRYSVAVTVQLGEAGGCPATFGNTVNAAISGKLRRLTLAPGASEDIGPCRGVVTNVSRAGSR